ncbi:MAG: Crp/Fnr family transcriptional regulator [Alphaproteobacteria bacterium]|nr:Crp/Fnr family transcriptional regulator [Alphaproteobacteria bacterium]
MLSPADAAVLSATPLFAGIAKDDLAFLLDAASEMGMPDGGLLFSQGDPADRFFLVLEGRVNLFALTERGDQTVIEVFEKGLTFAEAAIFSSGSFPLNAEATPGTRLLRIPAAPFLRRLSERRKFAFEMLAGLSRWQRHLLREIGDLRSKSPVQRLGSFILSLTEATAEGEARLRLPLTKAVLASRIGITPESLSRALARLKPVGVGVRGREVVVADLTALRQFCQGSLDC